MSCLYNFTAATMILRMTNLGATCPVVSTAQPNIITPAERSSRGCTKMGSYRFTMMIMFLRMVIRSISDKSNNYDYILPICLIFWLLIERHSKFDENLQRNEFPKLTVFKANSFSLQISLSGELISSNIKQISPFRELL